jgi:Fur family peroxide stress response transcriptional regulator
MHLNPEEPERRTQRLREGLKRAGVKATPQRLAIYREIAQSSAHPDAETVYASVRRTLPTVSLDTVYRTLWLFVDLGLVDTLSPPRYKTRFDANISGHHHFVCMRCGATRDIQSETFDRLTPPADVGILGRADKVQVEVKGLCTRCLKDQGGNNDAFQNNRYKERREE